jgi:tRNA-specific 2-thiouridylase
VTQTLAVALSGGIDSLTAAFLLREKGFSLIGVHFTTGYETRDQDLSALSALLGIPVHRVDLSADFRRLVVDYLTGSYLRGLTPNPCLVCNREIKFGVLLQAAIGLGASQLATGHYARIRKGPDGAPILVKGADPLKDQSYFLAMLTREQLLGSVFPLGDLTKEEVRGIARRAGLTPLQDKESQDICFIQGTTLAGFIEQATGIVPGPGPIVTVEGREIGRHQGLHRFTIGQRRGINCPGPEPYHVLALDTAANTLVVGTRSQIYRSEVRVTGLHLFDGPLAQPVRVVTRIRYAHPGSEALLCPGESGSALIRFESPQPAVTPGQFAVFYQGDRVLGAGVIQ